jgi:subfamily B ATP-binding cassette protein MsbA
MRMRLARHLLGLSMRYHGERRFGDLLSRISNDVSTTLMSVNVVLKDCTQLPLLVLGSLLVAFFTAPVPTLSVLLVLPLIAVPIAILGRRVRKRSTKSLSSLGASVQVLTQMFSGIRTVKAFRAEERELDRYAKVNDEYLTISMRMVRAIASIEAWTALLSNLGLGLLLALIVWLNGGTELRLFHNAGEMGAFLLAIALIYGHVKRLTNSIGKVQEAAGAADRLQALLDEPLDIVERPNAHAIQSMGKGIRFERVNFTYPGSETPALAELDLEVRSGEVLALVGASGSGKSTLIDLIARFIDPSEGRVAVDGRDLRELTIDSWTGQFAMVGQVPFLFHASILDNIRYGKPNATQAEVEDAARAANIHDFIDSLPDQYATTVGDSGTRLSGGQRQRITIARAILKGAPLLLLDEATSALDSESEAVVQEALDHLMRGKTVIVIAHRLSTIRNADRIAVLEAGRLVELGSHGELLARKGAYWRLHSVQFQTGSDSVATSPAIP